MQFYLNGYNPGDPDIQAAAPGAEARPAALPEPPTFSSSAPARPGCC